MFGGQIQSIAKGKPVKEPAFLISLLSLLLSPQQATAENRAQTTTDNNLQSINHKVRKEFVCLWQMLHEK